MSAGAVLHGVDVRGAAWVLSRPEGSAGARLPGATPVATFEQQLEQRYTEGVRDGRAAKAERAESERQAASAQDLAQALAQAAQDGHAQGQAKAMEEARLTAAQAKLEVERRVHALEATARSLVEQSSAALDDLEDELVGMCHDVICHILGEVGATPVGIRALVRQALEELQGRVTAIHLHPDDLSVFQASSTGGFDSRIRWVPDSTISLGGAIVKSEVGSIDARFETQLQGLATTLRQARVAQRAHHSQRS